MSGTQLSFTLRVSSGVKTVHLLGSWDNYVGQLPLSKDKSASKGTWKGTFRFSNSTLPPGRYWYYYIIDGYHTVHNPSEPSTVEPTTGRSLNIMDVGTKSSHKSSSGHKSSSSKHHSSSKDKHSSSKRHSHDLPKGRPLSMSQIKQPKPTSPHATKHILEADYLNEEELEELTARFNAAGLEDEEYLVDFASGSPVSSESDLSLSASDSDLSYRSDSSSPNSSLSGYSTPNSDYSNCTCQRYGITRKGERVKMVCGGSRCGYTDSSDSCSSSGEEEDLSHSARRNGVVVRR